MIISLSKPQRQLKLISRKKVEGAIREWSLFCSVRVCTSLHFLPILLENQFFCISFPFLEESCISDIYCVKSVHIRSQSSPDFSRIQIEYGSDSVSFCIQSECGNTQTRITSNTDTFHAVIHTSERLFAAANFKRL